MNQDKYLQSYTGNIYKVMDQYLLQLSPWKDGDDRRLYSYDDSNMTVITLFFLQAEPFPFSCTRRMVP